MILQNLTSHFCIDGVVSYLGTFGLRPPYKAKVKLPRPNLDNQKRVPEVPQNQPMRTQELPSPQSFSARSTFTAFEV